MNNRTVSRPTEVQQTITLPDGRQLPLDQPLVMGVVNVTPDSFSDGGRFLDISAAVDHALRIVQEGASIIDIGGESSRPGAEPVTADAEMERVLPVIEQLRRHTATPISIDTYKAATAEAALTAGASLVNDISALRFDERMTEVVASSQAPVVLMHMLGTPRDMQKNPHYDDCIEEIATFFEERIEFCVSNGIDRSRLILDPGIGFGKRLGDNLEILAGLRRFKQFSLPLLVGASRKSFIGMLHPTGITADRRIGGSIAAAVAALINGADILRVHDVAETVEAVKVIQAVRETT